MAQGRAVPSVSTVLSIERLIAWPAQPNIDGYQFWAGVCVLPLLALRCTRIATHLEKKAIHIDGKRLKKLAKFVEFPGFVSRTDNKAYMDYLRIPHANRAQSLLPLLFFFRLLIFYSLLQKKFTPNYFRILYLYVQYQRRFRIILFYSRPVFRNFGN